MNPVQIKQLIHEYYSTNTNTLKKELEGRLMQCRLQPNTLKIALQEITTNGTEFEQFFYLSVFEVPLMLIS